MSNRDEGESAFGKAKKQWREFETMLKNIRYDGSHQPHRYAVAILIYALELSNVVLRINMRTEQAATMPILRVLMELGVKLRYLSLDRIENGKRLRKSDVMSSLKSLRWKMASSDLPIADCIRLKPVRDRLELEYQEYCSLGVKNTPDVREMMRKFDEEYGYGIYEALSGSVHGHTNALMQRMPYRKGAAIDLAAFGTYSEGTEENLYQLLADFLMHLRYSASKLNFELKQADDE